jgi:hypothetical protein
LEGLPGAGMSELLPRAIVAVPARELSRFWAALSFGKSCSQTVRSLPVFRDEQPHDPWIELVSGQGFEVGKGLRCRTWGGA